MMVKQAEKIYSAFVDVTEEQTQLWLVIVFSCQTYKVHPWCSLSFACSLSGVHYQPPRKKGTPDKNLIYIDII